MHPYLLGLISSSSDGGGGLLLSHRNSPIVLGLWSCQDSRRRRAVPVAASMINGKRDHYAILDVSRSASTPEIKQAYRLLARKYHPDVSQDTRAGEVFKSIHHAYEVLSNDITRAQYDNELKIKEVAEHSSWRNCVYDPEIDDTRRTVRWAELRYQMKNERRKAKKSRSRTQPDTYEETSNNERGSFSEVLRFAFSLFFLQVIGSRLTLALSSLAALLDSQLDAGYKMGYVMAWCLGGQGGVLLTLCISFASWLCGKNSSGLVALTVLALWVAVNLSMFVPLPQGAVIALLYMSLKFQVN